MDEVDFKEHRGKAGMQPGWDDGPSGAIWGSQFLMFRRQRQHG